MEEADRHRHVWNVGHVSNLPPQPPVSVAVLLFQKEYESKLRFPQLSPEQSAMSPTVITAEAKTIGREFCLILFVRLSNIVLLSDVALCIQCECAIGIQEKGGLPITMQVRALALKT